MASDHAIPRDDVLVHSEIAAAMLDERVEFLEGTLIEQQFETFTSG
jgi:hypothetical protein